MAFTKDQIGRMTSEEYKQNIGDERFSPLTEAQKEFRAFVDGGTSVEPKRLAPQIASSSPRGRAEVATSFDPSFDDVTPAAAAAAVTTVAVLEPPVEAAAPAPVVIVPAVELPEKIHEYQPTDKDGKPIGGLQRFKYRTSEELIAKLTQSNMHGRRKWQELSEEKILNGVEIPADATVAGQLAMRPLLTDEERSDWEVKAQDVATAAQSRYMLDRDDDRRATNDLIRQNFENSVLLALESFKNRNRDYVPSKENATKVVGYVSRRGLDPTDVRNYQKAYDVLRESGLITSANQLAVPELATEAPSMREEKTAPNTQVPVAEPARISDATPPQEKRPVAQISTGLSSADSISEGETTAKSILDAFDYRHIFKDGAGKPTGVVKTFKREDAYNNMPSEMHKHFLEEDKRQRRITGTGNGFPEWCDACEAKIAADHAALRRSR